MKKVILFAILAASLVSISITTISAQSQSNIPSWVKTNALWWGQDRISDADYLQGLQYLIENKMLRVSNSDTSLDNKIKMLESENRYLKNDITYLKAENKQLRSTIDNTNTQPKQSIQSYIPQKCSGSAKCISETITQVIDGDTIYTTNYKIRLSLTNTPEINQSGFSAATKFTAKMCPVGSTITIDQDDLQYYDAYGRLLGNVYCGGKSLNSELLYNGHANILTQYCSTSEFSNESWAQEYGCGESSSASATTETDSEPTTSSQQIDCDPSYPDFCIPPPPPDLDCKDISQKRFTVL